MGLVLKDCCLKMFMGSTKAVRGVVIVVEQTPCQQGRSAVRCAERSRKVCGLETAVVHMDKARKDHPQLARMTRCRRCDGIQRLLAALMWHALPQRWTASLVQRDALRPCLTGQAVCKCTCCQVWDPTRRASHHAVMPFWEGTAQNGHGATCSTHLTAGKGLHNLRRVD